MSSEVFSFDLLFNAATGGAVTAIKQLDSALDHMGANAVKEAAKAKAALGSLNGGGMFNGLKSAFAGIGQATQSAIGNAAKFSGSLSPIGGQITGLAAGAGAAALGVTAVAAAMVGGALAASKWADAIDDAANALDVSTGFLQTQQGAVILAGGSAEAFDKAMGKLNVNIGEAASGTAAAEDKFKSLGVSIRDSGGELKSNEAIFEESRAALAALGNDQERAAAAQSLFGKGARDLGSLLEMNGGAYDALTAQVAKYGVASDAAIQQAGKLGDGMDLLGGAVKAGVINAFAPLAEFLGKLAISVVPLVGESFKFLGGVFDTIGAVVSVLWDGLTLLWDAFTDGIAAITSLIPGFDSLVGWFKSTSDSSRSMRDRFIDALQAMAVFAGRAVGAITSRFAYMAATIHNAMAAINNAVYSTGMGRLVGVTGRMETRDANAEAAAARKRAADGAQVAVGYLGTKRSSGGSTRDRRGGTGSLSGAGGGGGAAGQSETAKAAETYQKALDELNTTLEQVGYTEEQRALAQNLARAGLSTDITQTNKQADAIRNVTQRIREAEQAKKIEEVIADMSRAMQEATLSAEDLAKVEARRRAGVTTDLTITSEQIAKLDALALAAYNAARAREALKAAEQARLEFSREQRDLDIAALERTDPIEGAYQREIEAINRELEARLANIEAMGLEGEAKAELIRQAQALADRKKRDAGDEKIKTQQDETIAKAEKLSDLLMNLWENPKETMKRFFADLLTNLLKATAQALIFGKTMDNASSGGGGFGGTIGSIFKTVLSAAFGGGRAVGGGVDPSKFYMVGEKGPELFAPGRSGTIIPNHALSGGGGGNVSIGGLTINVQGSANDNVMLNATREWERVTTNLIRKELKNQR